MITKNKYLTDEYIVLSFLSSLKEAKVWNPVILASGHEP